MSFERGLLEDVHVLTTSGARDPTKNGVKQLSRAWLEDIRLQLKEAPQQKEEGILLARFFEEFCSLNADYTFMRVVTFAKPKSSMDESESPADTYFYEVALGGVYDESSDQSSISNPIIDQQIDSSGQENIFAPFKFISPSLRDEYFAERERIRQEIETAEKEVSHLSTFERASERENRISPLMNAANGLKKNYPAYQRRSVTQYLRDLLHQARYQLQKHRFKQQAQRMIELARDESGIKIDSLPENRLTLLKKHPQEVVVILVSTGIPQEKAEKTYEALKILFSEKCQNPSVLYQDVQNKFPEGCKKMAAITLEQHMAAIESALIGSTVMDTGEKQRREAIVSSLKEYQVKEPLSPEDEKTATRFLNGYEQEKSRHAGKKGKNGKKAQSKPPQEAASSSNALV